MHNDIESLIALLWVALATILLAFFFALISSLEKPEEEVYAGGYCGVGSNAPAHKVEMMETGRTLFRENCAACHNQDMKSDMTGPALGGMMNRWNGDTLMVAQFLNNPHDFLDTTKNEYVIQMIKKYLPAVKMPLDLSYDEVKAVVDFIEIRHYYY